ncbi:MAG: hypothetical protein A3C08_01015 [Candidatus Taylorbacteria bacterium RIFCSPHIGHO2_02_FULL_47_18]|uniref:Glycosyltransferase RgtA/B/C/D-like domain-containing protein n=1 Tax=Candidatus Taylorbacteria bacterium RIFCSPLOWO2_01_FULL_48_100 TaxID=1802322 RepID=A0A1G2NE86_9BACT|nr:MAG: hypothetical protein A2670_00415 [Candidatus Taylorbacteria bacterium RIFCSPHIGHO2_01_FULL_48_38]OHA28267.1 MAG: hypothetical protein A3C08_01015 [Candidatus Taylorbacteria bacterium RIFCSPHIGHO2_02_FULL_47_18]OHA33779.1 MAG: hypothetical protein A2938_00525 [Candidatus Taylorbacteria bacterium RIFCSPLOWO2_01_FULL_48_100]OHA44762.1 MAG: hypothetical protein A3H13_00550 [Candidatus Taylorbacteria bacterium RIFCSPLOWO2_12_FULL_48_11]
MKRKSGARKSGKQGAFFFGVRRVREAVWRGVHPFCFRSCKTRANDIISSMNLLSFLEPKSVYTERMPFVLWMRTHTVVIVLLLLLFALYGFFLAHKIDLTTADLGRHIKNGEILFQDTSVLSKNYYSYTNPDFPVLNHHWVSGAMFYFAYKLGGFPLIQVFFIFLSFSAFAVFLLAARKNATWGIIGLAALLAIPLLGERTEIRPEVWSYLFAGLFFLILSRKYKLGTLWLLPIIEIFWVNTHIYFLLGPLLIGAFLLEALIKKRDVFLRLLSVFGAALAAMLVNPFGHRAITEAIGIFENYGYKVAENQSVWFLERLGMHNPNFFIFKIALAALVLSYVAVLIKNRVEFRFAHFFVMAGVSTLAVLATRNFTLFGLFLVPVLSENAALVWKNPLTHNRLEQSSAFCAALLFALFVIFALPRAFPYWRTFGIGLENGNNAAANFLRENKIQGPYFNNYDIGGYIIFHLFPREKVFVDNRPEAYPVEFFQKEYIPMQENAEKWRAALARYNFNAIVFSQRDATPWGQTFLRARAEDPLWVPVFADGKIIIFTRKQ